MGTEVKPKRKRQARCTFEYICTNCLHSWEYNSDSSFMMYTLQNCPRCEHKNLPVNTMVRG